MNDLHASSDAFDPKHLAECLQAAGHSTGAGIFADEAGICFLLGMSDRTLRDWRQRGVGPPCYRAHRWLYPLDEFCTWLQNRSTEKVTGEDRHEAAD